MHQKVGGWTAVLGTIMSSLQHICINFVKKQVYWIVENYVVITKYRVFPNLSFMEVCDAKIQHHLFPVDLQ